MRTAARLLAILLPLAFLVQPADAQILKKLKEKAKETVEKAVENPPERAEQAKEEKQEAEAEAQADQEKPALKPGEGAWANYDFVPGDRILYFDDFTKDVVGDFPRRMEFRSGALEIVEWQGGRWLQATADSKFFVVLPEVLPGRFTMEFDFSIPVGEVWVTFGDDNTRRLDFAGDGRVSVRNTENDVEANGYYDEKHERDVVRHARVLGDGKYVKVYLNDKRILNVPNADLPRVDRILFYTDAAVDRPSLFGNFRIAEGSKKLYDALAAEGRVATQGILFDTGSDRIRPESTPTLKEIGAMLEEHPELRLLIEGHTDNVGDDAANLALSDKRAAAVKAYLVEHGASAARLETKGLGETKPAATNDTAEGRQQNRRVELVRLGQ